MIHHSQPYITPLLHNKINGLLKNKDLHSDNLIESVLTVFQNKFHQGNIYFTQKGSHALYWVIKGLGFTEKDEVIMPTYLCPSVYQAVLAAGAKPVLCDIDPSLVWHMSRQTVEPKITRNTKAIIVVNLYGMYLNCTDFRFPGIALINDLCQSFDVLRNPAKDHGDFAIYSFHPTKFITAGSGGGFSIINSDLKFKNFLNKDILDFSISNMDLLILQEQLRLYDTFILKRKKIADFYFSLINQKYTRHILKKENTFYRFPLFQESYDFSRLQDLFKKKQVAVRRGVDQLIHRVIGLQDANFPNSVRAYNSTLSIPIYPSLKRDEVKMVSTVVSEALDS